MKKNIFYSIYILIFSCLLSCEKKDCNRKTISPSKESVQKKLLNNEWLEDNVILKIARSKGYGDEFSVLEEDINALGGLSQSLSEDAAPDKNLLRLSIIINTGGIHWVCLVAHRISMASNWEVYYMDSLGGDITQPIATTINAILGVSKDQIHILSFRQQDDGYNCGVYSLENLDTINNEIQNNLTPEQIKTALENKFIDCEQLRKNWANSINWN